MKWLARLKNVEMATEIQATKTTKTVSVVFVAPVLAPMLKTAGDSLAANDSAIQVSPSSSGKVVARFYGVTDSDLCCYPNSEAMNGAELTIYFSRLERFTDLGVRYEQAELLADKLVARDRQFDDRRLCLECKQLKSHAGAWSCRSWQQAEIAFKERDAGLPSDLVQVLQRCNGFKGT